MTFIHGYLLGGLLLVGVPVLLHLIMRQRPRHLQFPAFRFLVQRHLTNRRKLRLQHLLLLLLRMGVIAALCLALARPRVAAERVASLFNNERPVTAVLIFDTSPSMEYSAAGHTRLEEAKQRARELLDEMDNGSQIALLDSGDDGGGAEWMSPELAQVRIDGLHIRPANAALNRQIDRAVRLLEKAGESEDPPPRFLYLFSDRTRACWDKQAGPRTVPEGIRALFIDVGAEKPNDLSIDKVEIVPPVVAPGERIQIQVTVRATGSDFDTELLCQLDSEADSGHPPDKQAIQLTAGQGRVIVFEREAPAHPQGGSGETTYQVTVRHQTADALPFNNTAFATFLTRDRRKVLTIVADPPLNPPPERGGIKGGEGPLPWKAWQTALKVGDLFDCEIRPAAEADRLDDKSLRSYAVVCLFQIVPSARMWQKLAGYVRSGGGLVVVPGGNEMETQIRQYNDEGTKAGLLPGTLQKIETNPNRDFIRWSSFHVPHPIPAFFDRAIRTSDPDFGKTEAWPGVNAFWAVQPAREDTIVVASYADREHHPALLDRAVGRGHVILFTTALDTRELARNRPLHNYWLLDSSFGLVLEDQVCRYLAGDSTRPELNYFCGQAPRLPLPSTPAPYALDGPGLAVAETNVKLNEGDTSLSLPQAVAPGNYAVRDSQKRSVAGCSLNVRPQESELERVPAEEIESVLGKETLLQVGRTISMKDALTGMRPPPLELLPWLMMAVLVVLTVESMLANRFYRRAAPETEGA